MTCQIEKRDDDQPLRVRADRVVDAEEALTIHAKRTRPFHPETTSDSLRSQSALRLIYL